MKRHESHIEPILFESANCHMRNRARIDRLPRPEIAYDWLKPKKDFSAFETLTLSERYKWLTPEDVF